MVGGVRVCVCVHLVITMAPFSTFSIFLVMCFSFLVMRAHCLEVWLPWRVQSSHTVHSASSPIETEQCELQVVVRPILIVERDGCGLPLLKAFFRIFPKLKKNNDQAIPRHKIIGTTWSSNNTRLGAHESP